MVNLESRALEALMQVSLASTGAIDPVEQAKTVLDELVRLFGAERAFLFLNEEEGGAAAAGEPSPPEELSFPKSA